MLKRLLLFFLALFMLAAAGAAGFLVWGYYYVTRDLPRISTIDDYRPSAVSMVFSNDGTLAGEFYEERGRRYPARLQEIPVMVRNCFVAAEDASFYSHPGIDIFGILRAAIKNVETGRAKQGGSTITQQVVKNLLLTREKKLARKVKEAILSYRLEKRLSKDGILEIYLNEIYFGNNAYGVKSAARTYFHKELDQLSLGEAALLAALPKAPARYSPLKDMERAKERQRYVLRQMLKAGFIDARAAQKAAAEELKVYRADLNNIYAAPYFVSEVRRLMFERWPELNLDTDGLQIHTSLDVTADKLATRALRKGLRAVDKRRGWRGPLKSYGKRGQEAFLQEFALQMPSVLLPGQIYPALVTEVSAGTGVALVDLGRIQAPIDLRASGWAKKRIDASDQAAWIEPEKVIKAGDVIEVALAEPDPEKEQKKADAGVQPEKQQLRLDQTPEIEGAVVLLDPNSGQIGALVGGYDYHRSQFNRVTQSFRQPGSAFKPLVYLAAIDAYRYTPATIVQDTPRVFRIGTEVWSPGNFDEKFLGPITLRTALQKSRNLVSVDIVSRIGIDAVIRYARKLGIESKLGRNLSLSLGSSEVTLLELTRAYGVFAARGILSPTTFITRVFDRDGRELYNYEQEKLAKAKQVINENSAFIMANMMKGVVEHGTAWRVRAIKRPVAGKTGTSNDQMDTWFVGFTPEWVCGVWSGFDVKRAIGDKETGGAVAAPIWLDFMRDFLLYEDQKTYQRVVADAKAEAERLGVEYVAPEPLEPSDFPVPDGVDPFWVDAATGYLSQQGMPGAIPEYFIKGSEPSRAREEEDPVSYLESPEL